jgi:hypothetical protein
MQMVSSRAASPIPAFALGSMSLALSLRVHEGSN